MKQIEQDDTAFKRGLKMTTETPDKKGLHNRADNR